MSRYSHGIIGGGVAGSRLATHLAAAGHGPIVLIEPIEHDPRTLALFERPGESWTEPYIVHRWPRLRIRGRGREVVRTPSRPYAAVRAQALRDRARAAVRRQGGTVTSGRVAMVRDHDDHTALTLIDGSVIEADWVYDSRVDPDDDQTKLRQTFTGVWVETAVDAFDPRTITLMDFDPFAARRFRGAARFVHTMPTSPRRALVTAVAIAPGRPSLPVGPWLRSIVDPSITTITGHEGGSTPLMTRAPVRWVGPRRLRIGNAGGLLKASTGYAVQRIETDVRGIVAAIDATGRPEVPRQAHVVPWRWLDRVFLTLVAQQGQASAEVFLALFERASPDAVVAFLEEQASCASVVSTVLRLPRWGWFARAGLSAPLRLP